MVVPNNGRPTAARPAMSGKQPRRVDLEPACRFRRDIRAGLQRQDRVARTEQQTANLRNRRSLRVRYDLGQQFG